MRRIAVVCAVIACAGTAHGRLNKQGDSRRSDEMPFAHILPHQNLTGYLFAGPFLYNPTYASRPNNEGLALVRFGGHLDVDLYKRWLTISYDGNLFLDRSLVTPTEWDHIVGILSSIDIGKGFQLGLAVHLEVDGPLDSLGANYSQSYVDGMARLTWDSKWVGAYLAVGAFLYNPTYAARPDNTGLALMRYQLHGEVRPTSWLTVRLDANTFTDREADGAAMFAPSELDATMEVAARRGEIELKLAAEADLPLSSPTAAQAPRAQPRVGFAQYYVALLVQWNFDARTLVPHLLGIK